MSWTQEPSLNHPRWFLAAATANAPAPGSGLRVYALGGVDASSSTSATSLATVEAYDTAQKQWSTTAPIPTPLREGFAAVSSAGRLHVLGGFDDSYIAQSTHNVYDPTTNTWSALAPLPTARGNLAAVIGADGLIYAIGGSGNPNCRRLPRGSPRPSARTG
jgi:N-acetylneuraminic acid mutarotase